ncbi:hypothetical protein FKP32DRAFT_1603330 [Trametes sanguinea]|nr:hypothetical protein FKP32DRAFT_1603330 [Trametes sanguinea]
MSDGARFDSAHFPRPFTAGTGGPAAGLFPLIHSDHVTQTYAPWLSPSGDISDAEGKNFKEITARSPINSFMTCLLSVWSKGALMQTFAMRNGIFHSSYRRLPSFALEAGMSGRMRKKILPSRSRARSLPTCRDDEAHQSLACKMTGGGLYDSVFAL